jgi:Predicted membrane protein
MQSIRKAAIGLVLILALAFSVAASDKKSDQKQLAKEAKITMKEARAAALKEVPGKIKEAELEREDGKLIYSFDISTKEGIKEVQIDALTGTVLKVEIETKEQEAKEKAAEHKASSKKKEATKKP